MDYVGNCLFMVERIKNELKLKRREEFLLEIFVVAISFVICPSNEYRETDR